MGTSTIFDYKSAHDYAGLISKWRRLSRLCGLTLQKICETDGYPVYGFISGKVGSDGIYLSSGIHGDEPAGAWALLEWAESQIEFLRKRSFFIFPCLNPWGFNENSRCDRQNIDLNRRWLTSKTITTKAVSVKMENYRVLLGVNLHEDYDANGIYLYEASAGKKSDYLANGILNAGKEFMPIDTRKKIEGRWARNGVIRPDANSLPKEGMPEAVFLQKKGAERIFVFETPSEFDLRLRVKTQVKMLERAVSEML